MSTNADLLRRFADEHCEAAFAELVQRHIGLVYSAALRQLTGNHAQAQEVTQDVFTLLARKAPSLAADVVLAGWLYAATRFTVANARRAEQRRRQREQVAYLMHDDLSRDPAAPSWESLGPIIDDLVQTLGRADREAIVLRFFQAQPYAAMAATLQVSDDAARRRVDRALEKLRSALTKRGLDSSSVVLATLLVNSATAATPSGLSLTVSQQALAGSASAALAGGIFSSMATSKTSLSTVALLVILAGGEVWRESALERTSQRNEASAARAYQSAVTRRDALAQTNAAAERAVQIAEDSARAKAETPAPAVVGPSEVRSDAKKAGKEFLARHPEVLTALREHIDAHTRGRFRALYSLLAMTPGEIDTFEVLQREQESFGRSLQTGTISIAAGDGLSAKEVDAKIEDLLGRERFAQYHAYMRILPARDVASNLSSLLVGTDTPLTTDQAQQVTRLFAAQADRQRSSQFNWPAAITQAQALLSGPQLDMLKAMDVRNRGWQQVLEATQRP